MIRTARLLLRDWREEDIDPFVRHTNTPNVMRFLGGVQDPEAMRAAIRARSMRWQRERGFTFWIVERTADQEILGFCGLKIAEAGPVKGDIEVGWRLREDAWRQGYAFESATAAIEHAFAKVGAQRVVALTEAANVASWRLMEKLGLKRRVDLDYVDDLGPTIVYVIERGRREGLVR